VTNEIEKSLLEIDFAGLTRRAFTPSPAAWEDQTLYFLLLDRFSDGNECGGHRYNEGRPVNSGPTPLHTPENLRDSGVEADVWKIEGIDRKEDCEKVVAAAHRAGRDKVGCIILGRGEDDHKVRQWLTTAASVPGFTGFAVGRTTFWEPLVNYRAEKIPRETAVAQIAASYRAWVGLFEKAK